MNLMFTTKQSMDKGRKDELNDKWEERYAQKMRQRLWDKAHEKSSP